MSKATERRAFSVAVFARHRGRILLIKHKRLRVWLPVGGEIDEGETPLEAAARELREETGLVGGFPAIPGVEGSPAGLIGYEEHAAGSKGLHMNFAFVADVQTETVTPNDEFSEYRWVEDVGDLDCPKNVVELLRIARYAPASPLIALARSWLSAFNARDIDRLLALYTDDAVHMSPKLKARQPETKGEIRGRAALRTWWVDAMMRLPGLRYEERQLTAGDDCVVMEYLRVNPGEESYVVAETLRVNAAGKIRASAVFHG